MREKLIEVMKDTRANAAWHRWGYEESADYLIQNNVVLVVRCKDCVNYCGFEHCKNGICDLDSVSKRAVYPNDFCSYGERKDNDRERSN